jgi:TfoX/Sxy family transcriptional regulator of competence genes
MAYDQVLAETLRSTLEGRVGIAEKAMFGGICWMLDGNMLCCTSQHRFMFRVGKDAEDEALARPGAGPVVMGKRRMNGFVWVDADQAIDAGLSDWIALAAAFVGTLPPKDPA